MILHRLSTSLDLEGRVGILCKDEFTMNMDIVTKTVAGCPVELAKIIIHIKLDWTSIDDFGTWIILIARHGNLDLGHVIIGNNDTSSNSRLGSVIIHRLCTSLDLEVRAGILCKDEFTMNMDIVTKTVPSDHVRISPCTRSARIGTDGDIINVRRIVLGSTSICTLNSICVDTNCPKSSTNLTPISFTWHIAVSLRQSSVQIIRIATETLVCMFKSCERKT
mmetsp:Transcript_6936/g.16215  ORF Transcript_6936/g.16215 Transcript_6936/m.16215 type:complete len:221 (+) Transcript_6936:1982-2644(+)